MIHTIQVLLLMRLPCQEYQWECLIIHELHLQVQDMARLREIFKEIWDLVILDMDLALNEVDCLQALNQHVPDSLIASTLIRVHGRIQVLVARWNQCRPQYQVHLEGMLWSKDLNLRTQMLCPHILRQSVQA
jgi:hypothetical protein